MKPQTELQKGLLDSSKSPIKKYQDIVIGERSIISLIRYELIMNLFGSLPGVAGLGLRKLFLKSLLGNSGNNITFGRSITLRHPKKIYIGDNSIIDDYAVLDAKGENNKNIIIGKDVIMGRNSLLSCKGGTITIGDNTNIGINATIYSEKSVRIGNNVLIAAYCFIYGGGIHRSDRVDIPIIQQGQEPAKGVIIEDNVWIGADVKILDGVTIGRDSIIGAGAVVNRDIPPFSIAAGIPASVIRKRTLDAESISP